MSRRAVRFRRELRAGARGVLRRLFNRSLGLAWRAERWLMRVSRRTHLGVQALAFTPSGELILVELRYLPGWHLPGGRRRRGEPAAAAMARELREELRGLRHGALTYLATVHERDRGIPCEIALFRIDDCVLPARQRLNSEVRQARAWPLAALPAAAAVARDRLARAGFGPEGPDHTGLGEE